MELSYNFSIPELKQLEKLSDQFFSKRSKLGERSVASQKADLEYFETSPNLRTILSTRLDRVVHRSGQVASNDSDTASLPIWLAQPDRLVARDQFAKIVGDVLYQLRKSGHPYHNDKHTLRVMQSALEIAEAAQLEPAEKQLLLLGALFHDFKHVGQTYRQLSPSSGKRDLSNEEFACKAADQMISRYLSVPQRLKLQGLILATSYGQDRVEGLPESPFRLFRPYCAQARLEKLLALADVHDLQTSFPEFLSSALNNTKEQFPENRPKAFRDWVLEREKFLNHIESRLIHAGTEDPIFRESSFYRDTDRQIQRYKEMTAYLADGVLSQAKRQIEPLFNDALKSKGPRRRAF